MRDKLLAEESQTPLTKFFSFTQRAETGEGSLTQKLTPKMMRGRRGPSNPLSKNEEEKKQAELEKRRQAFRKLSREFEEAREQLIAHVRARELPRARRALLRSLWEKAEVSGPVTLPPPRALRRNPRREARGSSDN